MGIEIAWIGSEDEASKKMRLVMLQTTYYKHLCTGEDKDKKDRRSAGCGAGYIHV
jgi:hypothetical protein